MQVFPVASGLLIQYRYSCQEMDSKITDKFWRKIRVLLLLVSLSLQALAARPGEHAPDLVLPLLGEDREVHISEFEGKIIYVDFWASWCEPCRRSLPLYESLNKRLPANRFQLLAVNLDEDAGEASDFLERHPVSYTILSDPAGISARTWSVSAMPSSYLIDSNGRLAKVYIGFESSHIGEIEDDIKTLLDRMPDAGAIGPDGLR
jgi:thiol-disulfide isomerase/thioredoxin